MSMAESGGGGWLRNRYWIVRHGKSIPNQTGVIVSSMDNGVLEEYKLAPQGVDQARLAGVYFKKILQENNIPLENIRLCYSPFSRTTHTAKVIASVLDLPFEGPQCKVISELRERYFGPSFELKSHEKYSEIWALDEKDPFLPPEGGESVADVASRLTRALTSMESEFKGCVVLIVSHGDPLQILQTMLRAASEVVLEDGSKDDLTSRMQAVNVPSVLSKHRNFALDTGELRSAVCGVDCEPWRSSSDIAGNDAGLASRIDAITVSSVLSKHSNFALRSVP